MSPTMPDLYPALPEIFLLAMIGVVLVVDVFLREEQRYVSYLLTQLTLLGCLALTVLTFDPQPRLTFHNMFIDDPMADTLKVVSYLALSAMLVFSRDYLIARGLFKGELFVLLLFALLGAMVMISARHFLTLYLGLELLTLSSYALVALQRDSAAATEAAMKYFVLGALASGLLLYGMSMLYGATGSLDIAAVSDAIRQGVAGGNKTVLVFGLVFVVAGLAFKLGVVPFHMWIPDVYHGAPTAIALFVGSAPKIAAFAFIMRLLVGGLQPLVADWQGMLIILAVLSMAIGNITAIAQSNIKRMLAYSTISHMGFLLLGVLAGNENGYSAAMFYVVAYVLMSLGAFGVVMLLSREGFEADNLDDLKGLNRRNAWYAGMMLLLMVSMAGIPFSVGFFAKLAVFRAALAAGFVWLVVVAVLLSLIGAFYYLRIIKLMYFDEPVDTAPIQPQLDARWLLSANGLAVLALGILPQPLMALCVYSIQHSF
jgi:NADH-quinone oxidoreductase subunit N